MPLLSQVLVSNLAIYFFRHFLELHKKAEHFWTFPTLNSYSNHLNEIQMCLNLIPAILPLLFFYDHAYFYESRKIILLLKFFSLTPLLFPFSLILFG